jgi:hypothetical protein
MGYVESGNAGRGVSMRSEYSKRCAAAAAVFVAVLLLVTRTSTADTVQLVNNGGFETGNFSGWGTADQGNGSWTISTLASGGTYAARSNQGGPGVHILYQTFVVPTDVTFATLSFDRSMDNHAAFYSPDTLSYTSAANQQARVDIMTSTSDLYSVASGDVLMNVFRTQPGDTITAPFVTSSSDLASLLASKAGQTLRLRFAEVDNQGNFFVGIDKVGLSVTTTPTSLETTAAPLPGTATAGLALFGMIGGKGLLARHRRPAVA